MEHADIIPYLRETVLFLIAAGVVVPLFHKLRLSPVLGFLFAGILIGPYGLARAAENLPWLRLATIGDPAAVRGLGELGVIFLLFVIGLELSLARLWALRRLVFGLGLAQVTLTSAAIAVIAWAFGNPYGLALVLGACLALSSTAIVMQLLVERRRQGTALGRAAFAVLLLQDLAVVPILFLVGLLGAGPNAAMQDGDLLLAVGLILGKAALTVLAIFVGGRFLLRPLFHLAGAARTPELFMALILLTVLAASGITAAAGLSAALGAFLAGLLLAETEYRHAIEDSIEPFKGLMLGLFFLAVGMGIDLGILADKPLLLLGSVLGLLVLKAAILGGLGLIFGLGAAVSLEAALLLGQGGEFAFVVIGLAERTGIVGQPVAQFMLLVTGLSMLATPFVAGLGRRLAAGLQKRHADRRDSRELEDMDGIEGHAVIAGFGRVGQSLGGMLDAEGLPYIALDMNPAAVAGHRRQGRPVFFGDAGRPDMLRRLGLDRARLLVVTLDDPAAAEKVVRAVRRAWPELPIHARARDRAHGQRLAALGAASVVIETVESSLQLGAGLLAGFELPQDAIAHRLQRSRDSLVLDRN